MNSQGPLISKCQNLWPLPQDDFQPARMALSLHGELRVSFDLYPLPSRVQPWPVPDGWAQMLQLPRCMRSPTPNYNSLTALLQGGARVVFWESLINTALLCALLSFLALFPLPYHLSLEIPSNKSHWHKISSQDLLLGEQAKRLLQLLPSYSPATHTICFLSSMCHKLLLYIELLVHLGIAYISMDKSRTGVVSFFLTGLSPALSTVFGH